MQGYKSAPLKTFLYYLFILCTAGLGLLPAYWFEKQFMNFRYVKCTMAEAEVIMKQYKIQERKKTKNNGRWLEKRRNK